MLTLACVVKTRANPDWPQNSVELMRQAIETLTFRWDEARGVKHTSESGLRALHVLECTMRIAFEMDLPRVPISRVLGIIKGHLVLLRRADCEAERVLDDIRRFFGLLALSPDGNCQFIHKIVHDYLAARYEVEGGRFQPNLVQKWDLRAAYAACLIPDATQSVYSALTNSRTIEAARECLQNSARFDPDVVAAAVFHHFDKFRDRFAHVSALSGGQRTLTISTLSDFFAVADPVFLDAIVKKAGSVTHTTGLEVAVGFCLAEIYQRRLPVPEASKPFLRRLFEKVDLIRVTRVGGDTILPVAEVLH